MSVYDPHFTCHVFDCNHRVDSVVDVTDALKFGIRTHGYYAPATAVTMRDSWSNDMVTRLGCASLAEARAWGLYAASIADELGFPARFCADEPVHNDVLGRMTAVFAIMAGGSYRTAFYCYSDLEHKHVERVEALFAKNPRAAAHYVLGICKKWLTKSYRHSGLMKLGNEAECVTRMVRAGHEG